MKAIAEYFGAPDRQLAAKNQIALLPLTLIGSYRNKLFIPTFISFANFRHTRGPTWPGGAFKSRQRPQLASLR
jgi:hypothetical protein